MLTEFNPNTDNPFLGVIAARTAKVRLCQKPARPARACKATTIASLSTRHVSWNGDRLTFDGTVQILWLAENRFDAF